MSDKRSKQYLDADVQKLALRSLEVIDTPISLGVYLRLKYGEWVDLANMQVNPMQYLDSTSTIHRFRLDYQAVSLLRKFNGLPICAEDRKDAVESFYETERFCHLTNLRLSLLEYPIGIAPGLLELLHRIRKIVKEILGPLPETLNGKFGPGTAFEFGRSHTAFHKTICGKIMQPLYCTASATCVVENIVYPTWWGRSVLSVANKSGPRVVRGNRFTTVPKDAMKDRGICVEPGANVFCQLAAGSHIRSRLFRVANLDLDKGQAIHQQFARVGSLHGSYSTIDLSNASDTISSKFVELALGYAPEWFSLLSSLRSPMTRVKGKWIWLEKFSSMGNGFTFELETLLFYAVALAASYRKVGDLDVKCYGDDIIVPTADCESVLDCLRGFGFTPNPRKTFTNGPFRESCGGDFFCGEEVTPYYLKKVPEQPSDWISIANGLWCRPHMRKAGLFARKFIGLGGPLPYGPREFGDLVIWERPEKWKFFNRYDDRVQPPEDRICPQIRWLRVWRPVPRPIKLGRYPPNVQLASALYGVPSAGPVPRDSVTGYKFGWVAYS